MAQGYDAVMASTGPSLKIDRKRTDDAINKVIEVYGSLENYGGLWIAAGTLGGQKPETSQRARICNQYIEAGVKEEQIRTIGGVDTMDKVRKTINLAEEEGLRNIGISTYFLHFLRFKEGLHFAKRENFAEDLEFKLIWSATPWTRWHKDFPTGIAALGVETYRLMKNGFSGATPNYKPFEGTYGKVRDWSSDDDDIPLNED